MDELITYGLINTPKDRVLVCFNLNVAGVQSEYTSTHKKYGRQFVELNNSEYLQVVSIIPKPSKDKAEVLQRLKEGAEETGISYLPLDLPNFKVYM